MATSHVRCVSLVPRCLHAPLQHVDGAALGRSQQDIGNPDRLLLLLPSTDHDLVSSRPTILPSHELVLPVQRSNEKHGVRIFR